ncbi:hypothetical protein D3C75_446800 [compost metagenome]
MSTKPIVIFKKENDLTLKNVDYNCEFSITNGTESVDYSETSPMINKGSLGNGFVRGFILDRSKWSTINSISETTI